MSRGGENVFPHGAAIILMIQLIYFPKNSTLRVLIPLLVIGCGSVSALDVAVLSLRLRQRAATVDAGAKFCSWPRCAEV